VVHIYIIWTRREPGLVVLRGGEVVVPVSIKEMYTGVPENRKSLTVIESIPADSIPPVVIVPGWKYMESWFHDNMA